MPDVVVHEEEVYEDEDDENEEGNWRNDYPDEESDDSDREERYGGTYSCQAVFLFISICYEVHCTHSVCGACLVGRNVGTEDRCTDS